MMGIDHSEIGGYCVKCFTSVPGDGPTLCPKCAAESAKKWTRIGNSTAPGGWAFAGTLAMAALTIICAMAVLGRGCGA